MTLQEIMDQLNLVLLTNPNDFFAMVPSGGYASDMLSCVMTGAPHRGIWVTLQAHGNIVAVAALAELCALIITEGVMPDQDTISKANHEGVTLLSTGMKTYEVVGRLWELGLKNNS